MKDKLVSWREMKQRNMRCIREREDIWKWANMTELEWNEREKYEVY